MRTWYKTLSATAMVLLAVGAAEAQLGPGPFAAFPTQSATDGRFLGFGCAGIATFEQGVTIGLAAPADDATFLVNLFDGDTGGGGAGAHWDEGNRQLIYRLYADPLRLGSTDPDNLIGSWTGNDPNPTSGPLWTASAATMPDNDWWAVTVTNTPLAKAPSGNYFYNLVIGLDGSCDLGEVLESNVKVAASSPMTFLVPRFGLVAPLRQIENDGPVLYPGEFPPPGFDFVHAPTTYDGTFEFFLNLPGDENDLRLYDGDFDFGTAGPVGIPSAALLTPCLDFDDPDTPFTYSGFPFPTTGVTPEGINTPGNPADDSEFDIFRRGEVSDSNRVGCVRYEVTDPNGTVYRNDNPSGSFEWEQFRIATPTAVDPADSDHVAATDTLPGGIWKVKSVGLDLSNLNFWFVDSACSTFSTPGGLQPACPAPGIYLVGDTVFRDSDESGGQDPGEPGILGVKLELWKDGGTSPIATVLTGDTSNPNWAACVANNTGLDLMGLYCFGVDEPGFYVIRVAAENFAPGGPLAGLTSTTGGQELTDEVIDDNVLFYDFGYHGPGKIGDRVWSDADGDGVQGFGETGINNVTMTLLDSGSNVLATRVTSGDGNYLFTDLPFGTYGVRVETATLPPGSVQTYDFDGLGTPNIATAQISDAAESNVEVDFGYQVTVVATGSLGDRVWIDSDGDGVQDTGEPGLNNITVTLLDGTNTVLATTVTSGDGNYTFANLSAGTYTVRVEAATLPAGLAQTYDPDGLGTPNAATAVLGSGENRTDVDFGYRGTALLGDRVWNDTDADGQQDGGEAGLNGITLELLDAGANVIGTTVTTVDGQYFFDHLLAGVYTVRVVAATLPPGMAQTYDLDGLGTPHAATVTLAAGEVKDEVDFGYRGTGSLGDRVWIDSDGDGIQDSGETGINNVTVTLLDAGANVLATTVTTGDGNYNFPNLPGGIYTVRIVTATLPPGVVETFDVDGLGTPDSATVTLEAGENRTDVDFGYRGTASVGDRVWNDLDGDGFQDAGEPGINNVTVTLLDAGGNVLNTVVTGGNGTYGFGNLMAGTYTVRVESSTLPGGFTQTFDLDGVATPNEAVVTLAAGQSRTDVDFGYRALPGSLGDRVWNDLDGDGFQDAGEPGLNGVTVSLLDAGNNVIATTVTSGDGNYGFANLQPGTYTVRVESGTLPASVAPTFDLDGTGTPHRATLTLAAGQSRTDVDFGYRGSAVVRPILECVVTNGNGTYTAFFGYQNDNTMSVTIPIGPSNNFNPAPQDRGQPTTFQPGRTPFWPDAAFGVVFDGNNLVWTLAGRTATASRNSTPCANHVFLEKKWLDAQGRPLAGPPANLPSNFTITATSTLGTATCSYSFGALVCTYQNQMPPALDNAGLWVPVGTTYTVTETGLPAGSSGIAGLGTFTAPSETCVPGRNGIQKYCTHTVKNVVDASGCAGKADGDPAYNQFPAGHAFWLPGIGTDFVFDPSGSYVTSGDGTAHLTGTVRSSSNPTKSFTVDIVFTGYTTTPPAGSPHKELVAAAYVQNGGPIDPSTWWYYTGFSGTLTGTGAYAGAKLNVTPRGPAFQVGVGANGKNTHFGASGWLTWTVVTQPTSGTLPNGEGDINIDLFKCPPPPTQPGTGTLGYWKTHPEAWPVQQITIGGVTYTKAQAIALMERPSRGDKTIDLFKQLVAAKLNVMIGNDSSCIASTIASADSWLVSHPVGSNVKASSSAWLVAGPLHDRLDDYNNGLLCAPHRD